MQSTLRLAYFAGHLVKVWFSQAHVLFRINASCAEETVVFFRRRKSFTVEENHFKICDVCVNHGTDESPRNPATRIKFCIE